MRGTGAWRRRHEATGIYRRAAGLVKAKDAAPTAGKGGGPWHEAASFLGTFLRYWLPVLVYVAIIFAVSSIANLTPPVRWKNADKLSHLIEYSALGFLLVRAFFGSRIFAGAPALRAAGRSRPGWRRGWPTRSSRPGSSGRVSSVEDFRADALGVLIGTVVYAAGQAGAGFVKHPSKEQR